jgi:hypothetical protein
MTCAASLMALWEKPWDSSSLMSSREALEGYNVNFSAQAQRAASPAFKSALRQSFLSFSAFSASLTSARKSFPWDSVQ